MNRRRFLKVGGLFLLAAMAFPSIVRAGIAPNIMKDLMAVSTTVSSSVALFYVTTTGASQVLTIAALTVSSSMTVDWGDSSQNAYTGTGARTHTYAVAGTYTVQFLAPLLVTKLAISDSKVTLNSNQIKTISNVTDFEIFGLKAGTFNSTDISAWRPTTFFLSTMPTATFTTTITSGGFAGWIGVTALDLLALGLSQGYVNQVLTDCYTAFATRTATGGAITLNGTGNAAPSGTYQSNCPPTSGKETAYDLINDPCTVNPTKKWTTITTN